MAVMVSYEVQTSVVWLSHFRPTLRIPINIYSHFLKEEGYVFQKKN